MNSSSAVDVNNGNDDRHEECWSPLSNYQQTRARAKSCPTGLLIDLNESDTIEQVHLPLAFTNIAEYDDTFGLFRHDQGQGQQQRGAGEDEAVSESRWDAGSHVHCRQPLLSPLIPPPAAGDSSFNSTYSPFGLGIGTKKVKVRGQDLMSTPSSRIVSYNDNRGVDPFSPVFTGTTISEENEIEIISGQEAEAELVFCVNDQMSPRCLSASTPIKVGNLSDSDSLLDINNLSGFSCSDSDGLVEQLGNKLKNEKQQNDGKDCVNFDESSTSYTSQEAIKNLSLRPAMLGKCLASADMNNEDEDLEKTVNTNQKKEESNEKDVVVDPDSIRQKKRRDSINSKLQRLSMLMSSPISSPPSPNATRTFFPTPIAIITPASRRPQSFQPWTPRSSVSSTFYTSPEAIKKLSPSPTMVGTYLASADMNNEDDQLKEAVNIKEEESNGKAGVVDPESVRQSQKKRRDNMNSKLQRLNMLMSSPISSPPSPNATMKFIPTPITRTTPASRILQSCTPMSSVSATTSPARRNLRNDLTKLSTLNNPPKMSKVTGATAKPVTPVATTKFIPTPITRTTPTSRRLPSLQSSTPRLSVSAMTSPTRLNLRNDLTKLSTLNNPPKLSKSKVTGPTTKPATGGSKENCQKILTSAVPWIWIQEEVI